MSAEMPKNAHVVVQYGPYEACGVVESRTSRLAGLEAQLTSNGHTIELQEVPDWNVVRLIVNGENVYKCDIKELDYGGDGKLDPLCLQAVAAVLKAY
ncbi:UPF0728 protein-like [Styela clava]